VIPKIIGQTVATVRPRALLYELPSSAGASFPSWCELPSSYLVSTCL